jgi:hypothetical protein
MKRQRIWVPVTAILILVIAVSAPFPSAVLADSHTLTGHQRQTLKVC